MPRGIKVNDWDPRIWHCCRSGMLNGQLCRLRVHRDSSWRWSVRPLYQTDSGDRYNGRPISVHWQEGLALWQEAKLWSAEGELSRVMPYPVYTPQLPFEAEPKPSFPEDWFTGRPVDISKMPNARRVRCQVLAECRRRGLSVCFSDNVFTVTGTK